MSSSKAFAISALALLEIPCLLQAAAYFGKFIKFNCLFCFFFQNMVCNHRLRVDQILKLRHQIFHIHKIQSHWHCLVLFTDIINSQKIYEFKINVKQNFHFLVNFVRKVPDFFLNLRLI